MTTIPYRPSNGTEGHIFMSHFCFRCARDAKFQETQAAEDGCPIIAAAFMYSRDDPKYPSEWVQGDGGLVIYQGGPAVRCTAFDPLEKDNG